MNEFIESLLSAWRDTGKFGLTLPFIGGALRSQGYLEGPESEAFRALLGELQAASVTYRLAYCDKAGDLILAPVSGSPGGCKRVAQDGEATSLWIQHDLVESDTADSIELYRVLWEKYGPILEAGHYSCTKGKYHQFTSADLELIERAFENNA
ncbi:MAG: hypothetical protein NVV73_13320 [Cellvibrionaceae bacterium]|nr:hypothetical protein [Cellvibrionaceae bacterium]